MSEKVRNGNYVMMTLKELKEYLKTHPNTKYVMGYKQQVYCDICGKRIDENKYYLRGSINFEERYNGLNFTHETYDLCSDACAAVFVNNNLARFVNQSPDSDKVMIGIHTSRYNVGQIKSKKEGKK